MANSALIQEILTLLDVPANEVETIRVSVDIDSIAYGEEGDVRIVSPDTFGTKVLTPNGFGGTYYKQVHGKRLRALIMKATTSPAELSPMIKLAARGVIQATHLAGGGRLKRLDLKFKVDGERLLLQCTNNNVNLRINVVTGNVTIKAVDGAWIIQPLAPDTNPEYHAANISELHDKLIQCALM